jgi:RND family efflux transporter MFP subunit
MTNSNQSQQKQSAVSSESVSTSKKQWPIVTSILLFAIFIAVLLNYFKPVAEKSVVKNEFPVVEYVVADKESIAVPVITQGSIKAKTYIKLVAEVNGQITQMAKLKFNGGFFNKGDLLLSIDDTDYRLAMSRSKAQVAAAKQQLVRAQTEATQAKYDLKQIGRDPSRSTSYALREPQLAEAKANLQAAQADLEISRMQMQRTRVVAPFDGRVVSKQVDIGQYVSTGTLLADIYSTESVSIRLPLSLPQIELLGIRLRNNQQLINQLDIKLIAEYASKQYQWLAEFSHTEGEIDVRNRLAFLVAEVNAPYEKDAQHEDRPPLTPGMFVKAKLTGLQKNMIKLPRSVLHYAGNIWLLDEQNQLQIKTVEILSKDRDYIYIKNGLEQGDRVITSSIDFPLQGMHLKPLLKESAIQAQEKIANE